MSGNTLTITGNITADPEVRETQSGQVVANFVVADTPRYRDSATGEWKDGETLFQKVAVWGDLATHVAHSITRGARVIVTGRLQAKTFAGNDGERRTYTELVADEVGASLRFATATITRASSAAQ